MTAAERALIERRTAKAEITAAQIATVVAARTLIRTLAERTA